MSCNCPSQVCPGAKDAGAPSSATGITRRSKALSCALKSVNSKAGVCKGFDVALPHGSEAERLRSVALAEMLPGTVVWPRLSLDQLTTEMAQCTGVIGVDSGLSHIAVALGLPHVQIYNFDTAWRTGPLGGALTSCWAALTALKALIKPLP